MISKTSIFLRIIGISFLVGLSPLASYSMEKAKPQPTPPIKYLSSTIPSGVTYRRRLDDEPKIQANYVLTRSGARYVMRQLGFEDIDGDFQTSNADEPDTPKSGGSYSYILKTKKYILKFPVTECAEAEGINQLVVATQLQARGDLDKLPFDFCFPSHIVTIFDERSSLKMFFPLHILPRLQPKGDMLKTCFNIVEKQFNEYLQDVGVLRDFAYKLASLQLAMISPLPPPNGDTPFLTISHGDLHWGNILMTSINPLKFSLIDCSRIHFTAHPLTDVVYFTRYSVWKFLEDNPLFTLRANSYIIHDFLTQFYAGYFKCLGPKWSLPLCQLFDNPGYITNCVTAGLGFEPNGVQGLPPYNPETFKGGWPEYSALEASAAYMGYYSNYWEPPLRGLSLSSVGNLTNEVYRLTLNLAYLDHLFTPEPGMQIKYLYGSRSKMRKIRIKQKVMTFELDSERVRLLSAHLYRIQGRFETALDKDGEFLP